MPSTSRRTGEVDGVDKKVYWDVVDHCYLCDMCYMTKCPYVPPHPWNVDFPHLMLRAKAFKFKTQPVRSARQDSELDRSGRQHRRHSGRRRDRERRDRHRRPGASCSTRRWACIPQAPVPNITASTYRKRHARTAHPTLEAQASGRDAGSRRAVRDLLRQSQRAGAGRGSRPRSSSTTASRSRSPRRSAAAACRSSSSAISKRSRS